MEVKVWGRDPNRADMVETAAARPILGKEYRNRPAERLPCPFLLNRRLLTTSIIHLLFQEPLR